MKLESMEVRVTGRVQRVGFRAWAASKAQALGLSGWVRNEPDGSVTALLTGTPEALEAMLAALHEGPGFARVARVEADRADPAPTAGFRVVR